LASLPANIELGDRVFSIRPLTIRQVQAIEPILLQGGAGNIATALAIIEIALRRDHSAVVADFENVEASAKEIGIAAGIVLRLGGFIEGDPQPGEAMPR
jgi:hypothetical protein